MSGRLDPAALRYRPELDGIRAVAVYLVVLYHADVAQFHNGFIGVDLFFVLSGFLVSGVILRECDERGTFSLGGFYARRVRRLLPAALVVVVATAALQVLLSSTATRVDLVGDARSAVLYFANWQFLTDSRDYFAQGDSPSPFIHFWSLSIEEQFYIGFPLLILLALKVSKRPVRLLALAVAVIGLVSVLLQVWHASSDVSYAYYATETRIYQLAAGVGATLLARWVRHGPWERRLRSIGSPAALVGLVGLVVVASSAFEVSPSSRGLLATAAAVLLIAGIWFTPDGTVGRLLALPQPRFLGQISYATYLWHWPVLLVLMQVFDASPWITAAIGATVATALASLSGHLLETPIRRSARLDRHRWPAVAIGLATSVVVALAVVPFFLQSDRRPVVAAAETSGGAAGLASVDVPVPDVDLVAAKADTGEPTATPCTTQDPRACLEVEGSGLHVLLLGDSQAVMFTKMFDALALDHDLSISTNIAPGCPWQSGQINIREGADPALQEACAAAREPYFSDVLPLMDIDVVVAVGLSRSDAYWATRLTGVDGPPGETLDELQLRTTRETAAEIRAAGPRLVIMQSIFGTDGYGILGFDPIECLASADALADCAVVPPLERPAVDSVYEVLALEDSDIATIDLTNVVCPDRPLCAPVKGHTVIWKDRDHVTASWFMQRRDAVWRRLVATGMFE